MEIGLLAARLDPADAVSCDVFGMHRALTEAGHRVHIFAENWSPQLGCFGIKSHRCLNSLEASSLLIYHYAIGWSEGTDAVNRCRCRKIVKYHNITPASFFEEINHEYLLRCRLGESERDRLVASPIDLYLSDSEFNNGELLERGVKTSQTGVVPPFHRIDDLISRKYDQTLYDCCRDGATNILSVGRIAPNKGHRELIEAFGQYHKYYNSASRLLIAGKMDIRLMAYTSSLLRQVEELDLTGAVIFLGEISDEELKACYLVSDVLVTTSQHEGFCVPLIEAMALGVPIVACGRAAVPGTVGDAGIVWRQSSPSLLAASIHAIVRDPDVAETLRLFGVKRYRNHFANDQIKKALLDAIAPLVA